MDSSILKAYLVKILEKMVDDNGKVQETSCSALCKIAFKDASILEQFIYDIVDVMHTP